MIARIPHLFGQAHTYLLTTVVGSTNLTTYNYTVTVSKFYRGWLTVSRQWVSVDS
jgi:hypothetical protein